MPPLPETPVTTNRMLLALPPASLARLRPDLEPVTLQRGQVIGRLGHPVAYLHFVDRGLVSLMKAMRDGRTVEIGTVGREGVTDAVATCGIGSTLLEGVVHIPGAALRIRLTTLLAAMQADAILQDLVHRYIRFCFFQVAQTAACNRLHLLEERCCRWLLTAHDSALSDTFPLTHEFLAMMLGVQRTGVSVAANTLKNAGLIDYSRGLVTITDRAGLEAAACECYASNEDMLSSCLDLGADSLLSPQSDVQKWR